jgi:non-homologous end joining protein Ku
MMRFADELADLSEFRFPKAEGVRQPERKMALQLIENLASTWNPEKLHRRIQGKPDAGDPGKNEGTQAAAAGPRDAAFGRRRRSHGGCARV